MRKPVLAGYYRDCDCWLYLTSEAELYFVSGPDSPEPLWRSVGGPIPDGAKPQTPKRDELEPFERTRSAYYIPE